MHTILSTAMRFIRGHGKRWAIPLTVFLTGAAVLVVEVVATRVLSPYFGNSIFTYSSVITVVLAALSIGYAIGGKIADRYPLFHYFYGIIALSGVSVLIMKWLSLSYLETVGLKLPLTTGPLIISIFLFFIPALLMGTLSPYAIKLSSVLLPKAGVGAISGSMFFWSTMGSIFGSVAAGFLLIPHLGAATVLGWTGWGLIAIGTVPLLLMRRYTVVAATIITAMAFTLVPIAPKQYSALYEKDGLYEKLLITDGIYNNRPTRFFNQDRSASGAMYLDSDELVYDYTKYYSLYELFKPDTTNALVIGGGVYSVPRALLHSLPDATIDVSEIEPSLHSLAQQYFKLPNDPRLTNIVEDGRRLLTKTDKTYDLIFSDVYQSLYSIPAHFTTQEFFQIAKSKLSENGIFIANIIGNLSRTEPSLTLSEMRTFQSVFPNSYFFAVESPSSLDTQNIMLVGFNSESKIMINDKLVSNYTAPIIKSLPEKLIDPVRFKLDEFALLTDDYAPVDFLTAKSIMQASQPKSVQEISGIESYALIKQQLDFGPRYLSSTGHHNVQDMIEAELRAHTNTVIKQNWKQTLDEQEVELTNIIGRLNPENPNRIIIGAHYDTKRYASLDTRNPTDPLPGANDGASGVAVILEYARSLAASDQDLNVGIDFVLFDAEEGAESTHNDYSEWYPIGSKYFADTISDMYPIVKPRGGIILDMVCDKDLRITYDAASGLYAGPQYEQFLKIGQKIDTAAFTVDTSNPSVIKDDHTALNAINVPTFDIIDFDYKPFHTTQDTLDKCSIDSLSTIIETLRQYMIAQYGVNKS